MADFSDAASVWQAVLGRLQMEMPREHFNTFLRPCAGHSWEDGSLVVAAASSFAVSWLELPLHQAMAQEALSKTLGRDAAIRYRALPAAAADTPADGGSPAGNAGRRSRAGVSAISAAPPPAARRAPVPIPDDYDLGRGQVTGTGGGYDWAPVNAATCNPRYTFDNFVVGASNQLACHAARSLIAADADGDDGNGADGKGPAGAPGYNPLLIYAGSGLGKTHLLHAIGNCARRRGLSVLYATSEQFTNEFVSAIARRSMREFRDRYRSLDLLLLDDVQFLAGKEQTQESLFHTFNDLHQAGARVVLTSDRPPRSIAALEERLRSRFQWGLVADIQPPSPEMRLAILHTWSQARAAHAGAAAVPDAVLEIIARRAQDNVRQLQGAFNRVTALAQLMNVPLTPASVEEQLDAVIGPDSRRAVTPEATLQEIARHYRIAPEQILGRSRAAKTAQARQVAMYLLMDDLGMTPTDAGRFLSGRSHSTALHGAGKIRNAIGGDDRLRQTVNDIRAALSG